MKTTTHLAGNQYLHLQTNIKDNLNEQSLLAGLLNMMYIIHQISSEERQSLVNTGLFSTKTLASSSLRKLNSEW